MRSCWKVQQENDCELKVAEAQGLPSRPKPASWESLLDDDVSLSRMFPTSHESSQIFDYAARASCDGESLDTRFSNVTSIDQRGFKLWDCV